MIEEGYTQRLGTRTNKRSMEARRDKALGVYAWPCCLLVFGTHVLRDMNQVAKPNIFSLAGFFCG